MERERTRRQLLKVAMPAAFTAVAGCAGNEGTSTQQRESTTITTQTMTTTTQKPTETTTQTTETTTTESRDKPGYKHYHWHGQLFFEIDGQLVNFDRPKYYLDNLEKQRPETVYFHFHDSAHGPNEWSNEKKIITFERGLNLLPGISYTKRGGDHVVGYKGTAYHGGRSNIDVSIHERTEEIDPTSYEIAHADQFWVSVSTEDGADGSDDTRSGKLLFDINNRRLDFTAPKYQRVGTKQFQFETSESPYYEWTNPGDPITLREVFDLLPDISYTNRSSHVITYASGDSHGGKYKASDEGTEISIRQRATDIAPSSYELQDGDIIWVYVHSDAAPDNEH